MIQWLSSPFLAGYSWAFLSSSRWWAAADHELVHSICRTPCCPTLKPLLKMCEWLPLTSYCAINQRGHVYFFFYLIGNTFPTIFLSPYLGVLVWIRRKSWTLEFESLCFLAADVMWLAAFHSYLYAFPAVVSFILSSVSQNKPKGQITWEFPSAAAPSLRQLDQFYWTVWIWESWMEPL